MSSAYDKAINDIKRYDNDPDTKLVEAMAKTYALVMSKRDSSSIACSDKAELATVKANFLKKKLGLAQNDSELDDAIAEVCKTMSADKNKSRLTAYYLLTKKFGKESVFV